MIFEAIALGGILYVGYQEYIKSMEEGELPVKTNDSPEIKTGIQDKVTQMFKEDSQQIQKSETKYELIHKNAEKKKMYDFLAIWSAFGLCLAGFVYPGVAVLSLPFIMYASQETFKKSYELIKQKKVHVSTLMSITIAGCVITGKFFAASLILVVIRAAMRLMEKVVQTSKQALFDVVYQQPEKVWIVVNQVETEIPFNDLGVDDIVVVQAGEVIPADGIIVEGIASIDEHILTGEARPIEKEQGDGVFAATVILSGKIYIKVEKAGQDCTVAKITNILNNTIDYKSTQQLRAQTLSDNLVKPALIAGGVALPIVGFSGALAVIYTHPKNKMMVIAPTTILNYTNIASQQGILIKDGRTFELLQQVDTIVFDKTGTLTEEQPHIGQIHCCSHFSEEEVLVYAGAAESKQTHPLAKAILKEVKKRQLSIPSFDESQFKAGYGVLVVVDGKTVHVGSQRFMEMSGMTIPGILAKQQQISHEEGDSLVMVAVDHQVIGGIELLTTIREEARKVIRQLKRRKNIKSMYIISGDHEIPTKKLARELGIDHYFAQCLPEKKADLIEQLQKEGHFICYIGDGINDSIALKKAQVSISMRGASTIATDTAQIILLDSGLHHLELVFKIADEFHSNMNTTFAIMLTPALLGLCGVFLMGFGISQVIFLNLTGLLLAAGNSMRPLLQTPGKNNLKLLNSLTEKET
ncbi:MAG: heavy metal translocating P-type ATPase [SAR324 cluster bacterium]|nr:heavy metal translocating P-type ATPase [SAR324 cluster bacterium]